MKYLRSIFHSKARTLTKGILLFFVLMGIFSNLQGMAPSLHQQENISEEEADYFFSLVKEALFLQSHPGKYNISELIPSGKNKLYKSQIKSIADIRECADLHDDKVYEKTIRLIDVNFDGKDDLIFSGACRPYFETMIFLKNRSGYEKVFQTAGYLISASKHQDTTNLAIAFLPCCCIDEYTISILSFHKSSKEYQKKEINFPANLEIIQGKIQFQKFRMMRGIVHLRAQPLIDNTIKNHECDETEIHGNIIHTFKKKTIRGYVISDRALKSHPDWVYVIFGFESKIFTGWMRREDIEL